MRLSDYQTIRLKNKKPSLEGLRALRLGAKDSNLYRLIQSQLSCHWTSPHYQRAVFYHAGKPSV